MKQLVVSRAKTFMRSTFIWLLLLSLVVCVSAPRLAVSMPAEMDAIWARNTGRVQRMFYSSDQLDAVLIGSSLVSSTVWCCDLTVEKVKLPSDPYENVEFATYYVQARHWQRMLSRYFPAAKVHDLSIPGCMAADDLMIVEKLIQFGKRPKLLIVCIAPRDFSDNCAGLPEDSPIRAILDRHRPLPQWLSDFVQQPQITSSKLGELLRCSKTMLCIKQIVCKLKSDLTTHTTTQINKIRNITPPAQAAITPWTIRPKEYPNGKQNNLKDLEWYRARYQPPNYKLFDMQIDYFKRLLALCKTSGIAVFVVDMPLTAENKALLDPQMAKRYQEETEAVCKINGVDRIQADKLDTYQLSDFLDSCHLGPSGSHKLIDRITTVISAHETGRALAAVGQ